MTPRKKRNHDKRIYFTVDTEKAIIAYNKSASSDEREYLYRTYIQYSFDKLAENIINRFKFPYINLSFDDLKAQVISFLVTNLHKYSRRKGKAFSYFSVVAKNYLILHNNVAYRDEKRDVSISHKADDSNDIEEMLAIDSSHHEIQSDMQEFSRLLIEFWDKNLEKTFKKQRDKLIAGAVIELFRNCDKIDNFNKKALYLEIREMTNFKTSAITKVVNKMRSQVLQHLQEYRSHGTINLTGNQ